MLSDRIVWWWGAVGLIGCVAFSVWGILLISAHLGLGWLETAYTLVCAALVPLALTVRYFTTEPYPKARRDCP